MTDLELRAHKTASVGAIENLMSLNAYYHAANPDTFSPVQTGVSVAHTCSEHPAKSDMPVRCLVSPVIEISPDGTKATALWYSPGFSMHHDDTEKTANVKWVWEKCGAEFTYENGAWKISNWNFHVDWVAEEPEPWTGNSPEQGTYAPCQIPVEKPPIPKPV